MKTLDKILTFIIWAIQDIGRSIKHNPLTEAWRKIKHNTKPMKPKKTGAFCGGKRAPQKVMTPHDVEKMANKPFGINTPSMKSVLCAPSRREIINRMSDSQRKGFEALRADIRKNGSVKVCEFGQKQ